MTAAFLCAVCIGKCDDIICLVAAVAIAGSASAVAILNIFWTGAAHLTLFNQW